jgi:ubiquinone/menaquinone biosynthesis C-methylase UbiE
MNRKPYSKSKNKGWDPLARWYDGMVGDKGSKHHQKLAIPAVEKLLGLRKGERVLDIACGQGVLAPILSKVPNVEYVGVDISKKLIALARERHRRTGEFFVGDATALEKVLPKTKFDAAVYMLSIEDIKDLEGTFASMAKMMDEKSRVVILMLHPAFRIPRQSGWGEDKQRRLQFRRIDSYLSRMDIPLKEYAGPQQGVSISHHRPLQDYVNLLSKVGFAVDQMQELAGTGVTKVNNQAEERAVSEIPLFLGIRAVKIK